MNRSNPSVGTLNVDPSQGRVAAAPGTAFIPSRIAGSGAGRHPSGRQAGTGAYNTRSSAAISRATSSALV